jgi:short-subunit dehydrogenase
LDELAGKIENLGAKAHVFVEDLSFPESGAKLYNQIRGAGLSVDILINNAGYGRWGELTSFERDDYAKMLQLNVITLTDLCHLYLPDMVAQGGGGIINVGSMASLSPVPYASVYSSSKAYVLMFSEAIRYEYQDKGINVMALLPGGTESEFAKVATEKSEKLTQRYQQREGSVSGAAMQTSQEVAIECLEAFEKNKQYVLCGSRNRFLHTMTKFMSRKRVLNMVGGMFKKVAG